LQGFLGTVTEGQAHGQAGLARRLVIHPSGFFSHGLVRWTLLVVMLGVIGACSPSQPAPPPAAEATKSPVPPTIVLLPETTPSPIVPPPPTPTPAPYVHIVQAGESLSYIAFNMGCTVEDIIRVNDDLDDPNSIEVGQRLVIPSLTLRTGPGKLLLPDSEFVYGPAYLDFNVEAFCGTRPGYLNNYQEEVNGQLLSGPEIVELVARHYSVGPRLLLAMLEFKSGWVDNPAPIALEYPLGRTEEWQSGLLYQLAWAADQLNGGYYDWKGRGRRVIHLADWSRAQYDPGLNAATAGVQYFLAHDATWDQWQIFCGDGPESFTATYRRLFGDPFARPLDPVVPPDLEMPELRLPWESGQTWYLTAGPHGGWNNGSAWAAGHEETGWNLLYMHVATEGRVPVGTMLEQGDRVGHPSCEAGLSTASHVHLARKYNGEWIPADGPLPMILSGWRAHAIDVYEGTLTKGDAVRTACECREDEYNGITAE
jgi:LasA protease